MLTERLIQWDKESKWEEIITYYGSRSIQDVLTADMVGKAYRMIGQYDDAIKTFKKGYALAKDNFNRARFLILVADCLCLQGNLMEADIKLSYVDTLKIEPVQKANFIKSWMNLQKSKYENDPQQKKEYLNIADETMRKSCVKEEYDKKLKKRLIITIYQQLFEVNLETRCFKCAEQALRDAFYNCDEEGLKYEKIENHLMEARFALVNEKYEDAKIAVNVVIKAALTPIMVKAAEDILKSIPTSK